MRSETFQVNQATVTVATDDGESRINRLIIEGKLGLTDDVIRGELPVNIIVQRQQFAQVLAQSVVEGDLGIEWPDVNDDHTTIVQACQRWLKAIRGDDMEHWLNTIVKVNKAPNDPDLAPADLVSEKKGKTHEPLKSDG